MMLRTWTLLPPSCAAMLPHMFSAATTVSRPPAAVEVDPLDEHDPTKTAAMPVHATRKDRLRTGRMHGSLERERLLLQTIGRTDMLFGVGEDLHAVATARLRRVDQRYTTGRRVLVEALVAAGRPVTT